MKIWDYDLVRRVIDTYHNLGVLEEASLGMHEDWFWTGEDIFYDGEYSLNLISNEEMDSLIPTFQKELEEKGYYSEEKSDMGLPIMNKFVEDFKKHFPGGIYGSSWATPVLQLKVSSQKEPLVFQAFRGENSDDILERINKINMAQQGVISKEVQACRDELELLSFKG